MKTVLITGASSGIGKTTAVFLAQNGYNVYATARRVERMEELKSFDIKPLFLDVTKEDSLVACVEQILAEAGRIDILSTMPAQATMEHWKTCRCPMQNTNSR